MVAEHNFPALKNDLMLRAARREKTERSPVWVMRQAGRYLPEFRELRKEHDFFEICRTPALACEITLQPIRRYSGLLDAAIIFSDILVIPQAMGMEVQMLPAQGPHFPDPIVTVEDAQKVLDRPVDTDKELDYVYKAITLTRQELKGQVPLIGFCGAPWTLFAYMIEGGGSKTFQKAKTWLWNQPELSSKLLSKIADIAATYLVGQIRAGAQLVQVFDSWAGELTPRDFQKFSLPYLKQISYAVHAQLKKEDLSPVPMIVFAKGANGHALGFLADAGYDVVGLDWTVSAAEARKIVGNRCALQGNLDPSLLYADHEALKKEVEVMFSEEEGFGTSGAHIANLGHGITPAVDPETMRCFLESVHKYSASKL